MGVGKGNRLLYVTQNVEEWFGRTALAVPTPLVEQMLTQLVDNGYLTAPEACAGCSLVQACAAGSGARPGGGLRFWTLTAKGGSACA